MVELRVGKPIVKVDTTEPRQGSWTTSGTVTFELLTVSGERRSSLAFPFQNASSEADAIRQASISLQTVAQAFLQFAEQTADRHKDAR